MIANGNDCKILAKEIDTNYSDDLNDWESKFIGDIIDYMSTGGFLSDKQISKLEQIYERVTDI